MDADHVNSEDSTFLVSDLHQGALRCGIVLGARSPQHALSAYTRANAGAKPLAAISLGQARFAVRTMQDALDGIAPEDVPATIIQADA